MLVEVVAAALAGMAVLWLVLAPLVRPPAARPEALEPQDPLETRRGQSLAALKELDFDREMGKLSDADYQALRQAYTAEALAVLREEDPFGEERGAPADAAEALIAARARVQTRPAVRGSACARCGPRPESDARFCSECGGALRPAACGGCGAPLLPDGRFCERCGAAAA